MPALMRRNGGRKPLKGAKFPDGFNVPIAEACVAVGVSRPTLQTWLKARKCPYGSRELQHMVREEPGFKGTWWMRREDVAYLKSRIARFERLMSAD